MILKKMYLINFILLIISHWNLYSEGTEVVRDSSYTNFNYGFQALNEDEILTYEWGNFKIDGRDLRLKIKAKNKKSNVERLISYWDTGWGEYQFSEDKKSGVFFIQREMDKQNRPLFFIDGQKGSIKYLFDVNLTIMTDRKLVHILYKFSNNSETSFALININTFKVEQIVNLSIDRTVYDGTSEIFRSLDKRYDFRIDYINESQSLIASSYYNIDKNEFTTIFDKSNMTYDDYLPKRDILPEELGK